MKNKLLAVLATFGMVASASAVKINNNLSINGFVDGSYLSTDSGANETSNIAVDEVELNFLVNAGNVSGELHIDTEDGDNDTNIDIEQVHFTYAFGNGASIQVGRFGSALGLEREDPAGLYTYSRAYGEPTDINSTETGYGSVYNIGNVDANLGQGLRLAYAAGDFTASVALFNAVGSSLKNTSDNTENDLDSELAVTYTGIENLSLQIGYISIATEDSTVAGVDPEEDFDLYTVNASYTLNKLLLAGEYISAEGDSGDDLSAYLLLADYDVNEKLGFAIRYSEYDITNTTSADQITFAPNYAITDSLGAIIEFSTVETDGVANDTDSVAIELTYTF